MKLFFSFSTSAVFLGYHSTRDIFKVIKTQTSQIQDIKMGGNRLNSRERRIISIVKRIRQFQQLKILSSLEKRDEDPQEQ